MTIPRKAYQVTFGEMARDKKDEWDITSAMSKTVMAETASRAIEIAGDLLSKKEKARYYISCVTLLVEGFDAD